MSHRRTAGSRPRPRRAAGHLPDGGGWQSSSWVRAMSTPWTVQPGGRKAQVLAVADPDFERRSRRTVRVEPPGRGEGSPCAPCEPRPGGSGSPAPTAGTVASPGRRRNPRRCDCGPRAGRSPRGSRLEPDERCPQREAARFALRASRRRPGSAPDRGSTPRLRAAVAGGRPIVIAQRPRLQNSTFSACGPNQSHQPIEEPVRHVFEDGQADPHVPGEDAIPRPAIDRADEVAGRILGLDHLDRVPVGEWRAQLRSYETRADGGHRHAATAQAGPQRLEIGDQGGLRRGIRDHPGKPAVAGHAGHARRCGRGPARSSPAGRLRSIGPRPRGSHRASAGASSMSSSGTRVREPTPGARDQDFDRPERGRDLGDRHASRHRGRSRRPPHRRRSRPGP